MTTRFLDQGARLGIFALIAAVHGVNASEATAFYPIEPSGFSSSASTIATCIKPEACPNALVFQLDELSAATCPGAAYCPDASSAIPTVTRVLRTPDNDAIVTAASQVAGCTSARVSQAFANLAHTTAKDVSVLKMSGSSYANVLASSGVDASTACKLLNTACSAGKPEAKLALSAVPGGDPTSQSAGPPGPLRVFRQVKPLLTTPASGIMGEDVSFSLKVPFEQVLEVSVNQIKDGRGYEDSAARLSRTPDGMTRVTVTPLLTGKVQFDISTTMVAQAFAAHTIFLNVALPTRTPLQFFADQTCTATSGPCVSHMHVGTEYNLWPLLILRAAPDKKLDVGQFSSYTAIQDAAHPVIALAPDGSYKALREGTAIIVVSYSGDQASLEVVVDQSFPLMIEPSR